MKKNLFFSVLLFVAVATGVSAVDGPSVMFTPKSVKGMEKGSLRLNFDFSIFGRNLKYAVIQGTASANKDSNLVGSSDFYKIEVFNGAKWGEVRPPERLCGTGLGEFYFMPSPKTELVFDIGERKVFEALLEKAGKKEIIVLVRVKMPIDLIEYDSGKIRAEELTSGFVVLRVRPSAVEALQYVPNCDLTDAECAQLLTEISDKGSNQALVPTPMSVTPAAGATVAPATGAAHL